MFMKKCSIGTFDMYVRQISLLEITKYILRYDNCNVETFLHGSWIPLSIRKSTKHPLEVINFDRL